MKTDQQMVRWALEESSEPVIKNPYLRSMFAGGQLVQPGPGRQGYGDTTKPGFTSNNQLFAWDEGTFKKLDKLINNQTRQTGMFAVTSLRFLSPPQASKVIEVLKKWHIRAITKAFKSTDSLKLLRNNGVMPYLELVNAFDALNRELDSKRECDVERHEARQ